MEGKKDVWAKMEVIIKFFNGVVFAGLTIVIAYGSQKVADSIRYGELCQKLLADLSIRDTQLKVRRDLSLITLNRTIGKEKGEMLAEMAEVICLNDSSSFNVKNTAFSILKEHDSMRANVLRANFITNSELRLKDSSIRKNSISSPEADPDNTNPVPTNNMKVIENTQTSIGASIPTIFIQTNKNKNALMNVKTKLAASKYIVPQIEEINKPFRNSVRYFNSEDVSTALSIAQNLNEVNPTWKCEVQLLKNISNKVPPGQIEVWIHQD
jgi:hypothetical protein